MHPLIEKYGKQTISELLDLIFICDPPTPEQWKSFLIRNGLLSKKSRATVQGRIIKVHITREWGKNQEGRWEFIPIEPYTIYRVYCKNGRGGLLFNVTFKSTELDQIKKELYKK